MRTEFGICQRLESCGVYTKIFYCLDLSRRMVAPPGNTTFCFGRIKNRSIRHSSMSLQSSSILRRVPELKQHKGRRSKVWPLLYLKSLTIPQTVTKLFCNVKTGHLSLQLCNYLLLSIGEIETIFGGAFKNFPMCVTWGGLSQIKGVPSFIDSLVTIKKSKKEKKGEKQILDIAHPCFFAPLSLLTP